jgi:hypothetical protein
VEPITVVHALAQGDYQVMNKVCYEKVLEQAGWDQSLIFMHWCKETANSLASEKRRQLLPFAVMLAELEKHTKFSSICIF